MPPQAGKKWMSGQPQSFASRFQGAPILECLYASEVAMR